MNLKRRFPKTVKLKKDLLSGDGYLAVSCMLKDGKILPALGVAESGGGLPQNIHFAGYTRLIGKYILCADNYFYSSADGRAFDFKKKFTTQYASLVELNRIGEAGAAVFGSASAYYFNAVAGYSEALTANVKKCVLKNGRIFGIDAANPYKIKWSGEGSHTDWTENISGAGWVITGGGYGRILNLVVYGDKIAAVRERGITFLHAFGTPENFKLTYYNEVLPEIYSDTAAVIGGKLYFYTVSGLYVYDGSSAKKTELPFCDDIVDCVAASEFGGRYILSGGSRILGRDALLVVNAEEGISYLVEADKGIPVADGEVLIYGADGSFSALEEGAEYLFESAETDFGKRGKKVLKELLLDADGDVEIEVSNGVNSRILWGVRGKLKVNMRGESFKVTIKSNIGINSLYGVAEAVE